MATIEPHQYVIFVQSMKNSSNHENKAIHSISKIAYLLSQI